MYCLSKLLQRPSVKDVDCQTCTTVSLQSVTAIQRSVPKGGGLKQDRK